MNYNETSLNKSHSKWSNFCLSFICFLTIIVVNAIWLTFAFKQYLITYYFYGILIILGLILVGLFVLIIKFKR